MTEINETISKKFAEYPEPISTICKKVVSFAQSMPELAVEEHLDDLIRKAVKREESRS
jgi:hypothetical protein